jgi:hypothetical protein
MIHREALCQQYLTLPQPLVDVKVQVHQYLPNVKSPRLLGPFVLQFVPQGGKVMFVVAKPDSAPLMTFPITRHLDFRFPARDIWRFSDPSGQQWAIKFSRLQDSFRVLAQLGLVSSATDPAFPAPYEPIGQSQSGRPVGPDDTLKLMYYAFSVNPFPYIDKMLVNHGTVIARIQLIPRAGLPTFFDLLSGMFLGTTRIVYCPGCNDDRLPKGSIVFVATLTKVRYAGQSEAQVPLSDSDYDYEYEDDDVVDPKPAPIVPAPEVPPSAPVETVSDPSRISAEPADEEEEELTEEQMEAKRKQDIMKRMRRIGAVPTGGMPAVPSRPPNPSSKRPLAQFDSVLPAKKARESDILPASIQLIAPAEAIPIRPALSTDMPKPKPAAPQADAPKPRPRADVPKSEPEPSKPRPEPEVVRPRPEPPKALEARPATGRSTAERLDVLERMDRKIDALTSLPASFNPDSAISGISSLVAQLKTKQGQAEQLQRQLAELRTKSAANSADAGQFDAVREDLEAIRRRTAPFDRRIKDNAKRIQDLRKAIDDAGAKAKESATGFIKGLMNSVFQEMTIKFEDDGRYTGTEVANELALLLRNQGQQTLASITEKGLI